jgi:hypothetical protein
MFPVNFVTYVPGCTPWLIKAPFPLSTCTTGEIQLR